MTEQQIKKNLKIFGITTQGQCFGELLEIYKNAKVETVLPANEATFQQLNDINGELGSEFASILKSILENRASLDLAYEITLLKQDLQNKFLEIGNNMLTSNSTECPFCGSEIIDIKQQIERRMADLQIAEEYIISQFKNINIHEKRAEEIIENIAIIPIGEIIGYLVSGGNFEQLQTINRSVQEIESKEYEKSQLHDEQVRVYRRLRNYEDNINRDLNGKFNDIEINFNDETNCIDITFPRNVDTYSNGEVNYLMFNIKLYEFIGSDKTKLIIDDILTSYDEINQYSLVYLLISTFSNSDDRRKKFVCFTHNVNTLRIMNNQHPGFSKMYVMDKYNDNNFLYKFNYEKFEHCIKFDDEINKFDCEYIMLLNERDQDNNDDWRHKIFHYDGLYRKGDVSNTELVELISETDFNSINTPTEFTFENFKTLFETKVKFFLGLRVYIENIIFEGVNTNTRNQICGKTIGKKIDIVFPRNSNNEIRGLNRSLLMSKKVMLNDFAHIENRANMPFQYILNIKTDDLIKEIVDIKAIVEAN